MRTRITLALLGLIASGLAVLTAAPAQAALPYCTTSSPVSLRVNGVYYKGRIPTTSTGTTDCRLNRGSVNSGVGALQTSLKRCNAKAAIAVDNSYGPATEGAVYTFQQWYNARSSNDIRVDGGYGPQTGTAMKWYLTYGTSTLCAAVINVGGA